MQHNNTSDKTLNVSGLSRAPLVKHLEDSYKSAPGKCPPDVKVVALGRQQMPDSMMRPLQPAIDMETMIYLHCFTWQQFLASSKSRWITTGIILLCALSCTALALSVPNRTEFPNRKLSCLCNWRSLDHLLHANQNAGGHILINFTSAETSEQIINK